MFFKKNTFEKYPDIQIIADQTKMEYKIIYLECLREKDLVRFERKEKIMPIRLVEKLIEKLI
jgi:hypothetical protein